MPLQINPHKYQTKVMLSPARFKVAVWGRRAGKTTCARYTIAQEAFMNPGAKIWVVALTFGQAKNLYWQPLVDSGSQSLIPEEWIEHKMVSELYIKMKNGTQIWLKGSDRIDSQLGESLDFLVLDEFQSQSADVWNKLRPMLSDRRGKALIIGTPRGYNHLYDMFYKGSVANPTPQDGWESWQITSIQAAEGTGLDPQEIEDARHEMSESQFEQEYLASFDAVSGRVFKPFSLEHNIADRIIESRKNEFDGLPLLVGMDFNVNPMTAVLGVKPDRNSLYILGEIYLTNSNTPEMIEQIQKYVERRGNKKVIVYPDASGKARTTTGNETNHALLKQAGFELKVDPANPSINDRINETNAMLCNAAGIRRLFIHSRCKELIKTMHSLTYDNNGMPDKKSGYDHMADAIGYLVHQEFPIQTRGKASQGYF